MTRITISERLEDCIQNLAGEVLREVEGFTEDEKSVHYLCRSIENLVRLYAEDAQPPQKRLAHERLNRCLLRLRKKPLSAAVAAGPASKASHTVKARMCSSAPRQAAAGLVDIPCEVMLAPDRRFKRRPIFR